MNVIQACEQMNVDVITLFRIAYIAIFNKSHPTDAWNDVAQWRINAIVPKYVVKYLGTL